MLEHLKDFEPEIEPILRTPRKPISNAAPDEILDAKLKAMDWLEELGAESPTDALDQDAARKAFGALTTVTKEEEQRCRLIALKTPTAVRHLTGMLAAYDWEFVEQAKELRGYTVAKIVEETKNPKAEVRLKALQMLGKVTEIGLFTDKVEVKQADVSDAELEARIKERLNKFMGVIDAVDVSDADTLDEIPPVKPDES